MGANRLEKFETVVINRQQLTKAEYNPRKISESAKKKLRKFLKEHGLWQPLIVNKNEMILVSGHQRLEIMDSILRKPDYDMTVSLIDVDKTTEVKGNVFMNNPSAMGEWDTSILAELPEIFPDLDFSDLGFDRLDIEFMFPDMADVFMPDQSVMKQVEEVTEADREKFRAMKKEMRNNAKAANAEGETVYAEENDYYLTVVFENNAAKHAFMQKIGKKSAEKFIKPSIFYDIQTGKIKVF